MVASIWSRQRGVMEGLVATVTSYTERHGIYPVLPTEDTCIVSWRWYMTRFVTTPKSGRHRPCIYGRFAFPAGATSARRTVSETGNCAMLAGNTSRRACRTTKW